ncbi:MAG: S53 family peptidase [Acidobacteriota bacterium]
MSKGRIQLPAVLLGIALVTLSFFITSVTSNDDRKVALVQDQVIPLDAQVIGRAASQLPVRGTIHFRLSNETELEQLLLEQQDPQSPNYHRWLTPQEFGTRFGARAEAYQETLDWLRAADIEITRIWPNRLAIEFSAPTYKIEKTFGVRMQLYSLEGISYYANTDAPLVPMSIAGQIEGVRLFNFPQAHPLNVKRKDNISPNFRSGGRVAVGPQDLYLAYNLNPLFADGIDGTGQTIGIVARSDFQMSDVEKFRETFKLPPANVIKIPAGGAIVNRGGIEEAEVLLDTQISGAAAPKATVQVVIAERDGEIDQSLSFFVNNLPDTKVISISFGLCERDLGPTFQAVFNNLYKQAAAQGQTVLVSSGDTGANDCRDGSGKQVNGLASSPFAVSVGGTSLNLRFNDSGDATAVNNERAWNGSGGGISVIYSRPAYQTIGGLAGVTRTVPDVSLLADPGSPGFFIVQSGVVSVIGGTSASAPAWAGIFALTNQFSQLSGLGLANVRIYQLGTSQQQGGTAVFNDITQGNNSNLGVEGFPAQPGYDLSTGWGSPNGDNFVRNFANAPGSSNGLFLIQPNGGEFLEKNSPFMIRWRVSESLAASITSQDLLLSTDGGATFQAIATGLDRSMRSFEANLAELVSANARFRVRVRTDMSNEVIDTSDALVNIGTGLRIEFAQYLQGLERLEIMGSGFLNTARIIINDRKIKRKPKLLSTGDTLILTGKMKKLKLKQGENQVIVEVEGVRSAAYKIVL